MRGISVVESRQCAGRSFLRETEVLLGRKTLRKVEELRAMAVGRGRR